MNKITVKNVVSKWDNIKGSMPDYVVDYYNTMKDFFDLYDDADADTKSGIDEFIDVVNKNLPSDEPKPKAEPKPKVKKEPKPKATKAPKAKKEPEPKAPKFDELVHEPIPQVKYITRFVQLHGKKLDAKHYEDARKLLAAIAKSILNQEIRKEGHGEKSKYGKEIMDVQRMLINLCKSKATGAVINIDDIDKFRKIAHAEGRDNKFALIRAYIRLQGKKIKATEVQRLMLKFEEADYKSDDDLSELTKNLKKIEASGGVLDIAPEYTLSGINVPFDGNAYEHNVSYCNTICNEYSNERLLFELKHQLQNRLQYIKKMQVYKQIDTEYTIDRIEKELLSRGVDVKKIKISTKGLKGLYENDDVFASGWSDVFYASYDKAKEMYEKLSVSEIDDLISLYESKRYDFLDEQIKLEKKGQKNSLEYQVIEVQVLFATYNIDLLNRIMKEKNSKK